MFTRPQGIVLKNLPQEACGNGLVSRVIGRAGRRITSAVVQIASKLARSPKAVALGVSLVLSALLTAVALRLPDQQWLAWISFLPLFVVVRSLGRPAPSRSRGNHCRERNRPARVCHCSARVCHCSVSSVLRIPGGLPSTAVLAGGFWGGCLYLFCTAVPTSAVNTMAPAIAASAWLLALLIVIPAVYVGLAARPAQAIGFKLLTLALGWTLIEVVLVAAYAATPELSASARADVPPEPRALARALPQIQHDSGTFLNHRSFHQGLLPASQGEGANLPWLARLLGYVATAFLVASVNASLLGILSGVRLSFPVDRSLGESPTVLGWFPSQVVLPIQSWILRQAHPRAPPIQRLNRIEV